MTTQANVYPGGAVHEVDLVLAVAAISAVVASVAAVIVAAVLVMSVTTISAVVAAVAAVVLVAAPVVSVTTFTVVVIPIIRLVVVAPAVVVGTVGVPGPLAVATILTSLTPPVRSNRTRVLIFGGIEDALPTTSEMLGVFGADVDHLLDLGHQRVRLMAVSLHVPAEILGGVPQETDIAELVSFLVGNT